MMPKWFIRQSKMTMEADKMNKNADSAKMSRKALMIPMPVLTFLEHYDCIGKRIIPFVTSGGSGFGSSLRDLKKSAQRAKIDLNGLTALGTQVEERSIYPCTPGVIQEV
jgi:hypothetical protein